MSIYNYLNMPHSYASGSGETVNNVMRPTSSSSVSAAETESVTLHVTSTASSSSTSLLSLSTTTVPSVPTPSETDETTAATVPGKRMANEVLISTFLYIEVDMGQNAGGIIAGIASAASIILIILFLVIVLTRIWKRYNIQK